MASGDTAKARHQAIVLPSVSWRVPSCVARLYGESAKDCRPPLLPGFTRVLG